MPKRRIGEKAYFSYKQENPSKEKTWKQQTFIKSNMRKNSMYFLHRDVEFDFRSKRTGNLQIQISLFPYLHYTVSLTRRLQRNESTTLSRIFYDKSLFRNPTSTLTAHTRPTPKYLATNFFLWPRFSHSMRASLVLLKLPRSCPKRILGNSAIPWQGNAPDSHFIVFFISVGPPSPTSKIPHPLKFLAFKTCPNCIGRSWNSSTERPERRLHSWSAMFTREHFRRPSLHETIFQTRTVLTLRLWL